MRRDELFDVLGQIDDRFIIPARRIRWSFPWQHYVGVAAALGVIVTGIWALAHMGRYGTGLLPAYPTDPTPSATTAPTDESTEPTVETTDPTETKPTEPELTPQQYGMSPDEYYPFRFDGGAPSTRYDIDTSQCQIGLLYVYDTLKDQLCQISDRALVEEDCFFSTMEHLYYRLQEDPSSIIRSDYSGENQTVIYRSKDGQINGAHYYGTDPQGKIVTRENNNRVCMYDIATETSTVLLERYSIISAMYSEDSGYFIPEDKYKGPLIFWVGQIDWDSETDEYLYCIGEDMDRLFLTGEPVVDSPESTESQEDYALRASLYNLNPDGFFSFVYDGIRQPYQGNGPELDVSQLQVGYRYVHDQKEDKVYQISDSPLAEHDGTPVTWPTVDYLYFVESDDPATVVRTDYYGQNRTAIYHSEYGEVTCLRYYGVDPQGKLVLVENTNRVIMYDIPTGEIEVIMEQPYICYANYTTRYTELPHIQWSGKREGDSEVKLYQYYPDTGEYIELDPL